MQYDFFHYTHLGAYSCPSCGYSRPETTYTVQSMDLKSGTITINGDVISLEFASKYNVYNICAAYTAASLLGVDGKVSAQQLSDFVMKNGRVVRFTAGNNQGMLITSKHENSTSYNQSLSYVAMQPEQSTLVIIVDAISRKYYTAETSWLWDISFELLEGSNVRNIILTGKYAYDLAARFELANITTAQITVEPDLSKMGKLITQPTDKIYAVTCFSDKEKLFAHVQIQSPTAK
jgi:UDP-N-acetylmuramyl tripeptide synthase